MPERLPSTPTPARSVSIRGIRSTFSRRLPEFLQVVEMADAQQPKSAAPQFEVPDLEFEPLPRPPRGAQAAVRAGSTQGPFDEDSSAGPSIELELEPGVSASLEAAPGARASSNARAGDRSATEPLELSRLANYGE